MLLECCCCVLYHADAIFTTMYSLSKEKLIDNWQYSYLKVRGG